MRFVGYGPEEDARLYAEDLSHCWDMVTAYCMEHGLDLPTVDPQGEG